MEHLNFDSAFPVENWDRNIPEVILLEDVFIAVNTNKSEGILKIMNDAIPTDNELKKRATILYEIAIELHNNGESHEAIAYLSAALRCSPNCTEMLNLLLTKRGIIFRELTNFEDAINDFKIFAKLATISNEVMSIENILNETNLLNCYVAMNNKIDAMKCIEVIGNYYKSVDADQIEDKMLYLVTAKIMNNLNNISTQTLYSAPEIYLNSTPYKGYSKSFPAINNNVSSACNLIYTQYGKILLARELIPKSKIVIIDKPFVNDLNMKNLQCSFCYKFTLYSIPCFNCHYLNYCSVECKQNDENIHGYECYGYKIGFIPLLNGKLILRLLLKGLLEIKNYIFNDASARQIDTSKALYEFLLKRVKNNDCNDYNKILTMPPDYQRLSNKDYKYCITIALHLTTYLSLHTDCLDEFSSNTKLNTNEIKIFIAALLLRHAAQLKLKCFKLNTRMSIDNNYKTILMNSTNAKLSTSVKIINIYRNLNKISDGHSDSIKCCKFNINDKISQIQYLLNSSKFIRNHNDVDDHALEKYDIQYENLSDLNFCFNKNYLSLKLYVENYYQNIANTKTNQLKPNVYYKLTFDTMYPILTMIQHSCEPNMKIVMQNNGHIKLVACRVIKPGEELTISYGVHYKIDSYHVRKRYLQELYIQCNCNYCNEIFLNYLKLRKCWKCNDNLLSSKYEKICMNCFKFMNVNLLIVDILNMQLEITMICTNFEIIYNLHMINVMILNELIGTHNTIFYTQLHRLGCLLMSSNYLIDALEIFRVLFKTIENNYLELSGSLLTEYEALLKPLFNSLEYNYNNNFKYFQKNVNVFLIMYGLCEDILGELQIIDSIYCERENCAYLSTKYDFLNIVKDKLSKILSTVTTDQKYNSIIQVSTSMLQLLNNLFNTSSNNNDRDLKVNYLRSSNKNNIIDLYKIYFIDNEFKEQNNNIKSTKFVSTKISKNYAYKNNIKITTLTTDNDPSKKINEDNQKTNSENALTSNSNEVNRMKTNEENKQNNKKSKYIKKKKYKK